MSGRLAANAPVTAYTTAQVLDPQHNSGLFPVSTAVRVFDSQGTGHDLTVYFAKTADNTWDYNVIAPDSEVTVTGREFQYHYRQCFGGARNSDFYIDWIIGLESAPIMPVGHDITFNGGVRCATNNHF